MLGYSCPCSVRNIFDLGFIFNERLSGSIVDLAASKRGEQRIALLEEGRTFGVHVEEVKGHARVVVHLLI